MTPDFVLRQVRSACEFAHQRAVERDEEPPVSLAIVEPREGRLVILQAPTKKTRRKHGDWLHIEPGCPTASVWRAISDVASGLRRLLPTVDITCVSYRFSGTEHWLVAWRADAKEAA